MTEDLKAVREARSRLDNDEIIPPEDFELYKTALAAYEMALTAQEFDIGKAAQDVGRDYYDLKSKHPIKVAVIEGQAVSSAYIKEQG